MAPETTEKQKSPRQIAVLGGGLTGLSAAWHLAQMCPKDKITLYEATDYLGGWIQTEEIDVKTPDGKPGLVYFEKAARMIQAPKRNGTLFDDLVFYEMVHELNLENELVTMDAEAAAEFKRYIYYPDHIVEMPSFGGKGVIKKVEQVWRSIMLLLTEPAFRGLIPAIFHWQSNKKDRKPASDNISLGQYYLDGFGNVNIINNLLSAMMHGIWGGDVWRLNSKRGPVDPPIVKPGVTAISNDDTDLMFSFYDDKSHSVWELAIKHKDAKMLWFRQGFSTLNRALWTSLERMPNVTILKNHRVDSIRTHSTGLLAIAANGRFTPPLYDRVVSTLTAKTLASLTDNKLPSLADTHAVTIQLVSLWYPTPNLNAPHHGIGYLLPQSLAPSKNPEGVLGVLFDSDREALSPHDTVLGTKFTVMMGGHLWDEMPADLWPSNKAVIKMAEEAVARHLNLTPEQTAGVRATTKVCRECIPQHYVGHWRRMVVARDELQAGFGGRLSVAGGSYQMPGVLGSIRGGRDIAQYLSGYYDRRIPKKRPQVQSPVGDTGLDRFDRKPVFMWWPTHWIRENPIGRTSTKMPPGAGPEEEVARQVRQAPDRETWVKTVATMAFWLAAAALWVKYVDQPLQERTGRESQVRKERRNQAIAERENRARLGSETQDTWEGQGQDPTGELAPVESDDEVFA